MSTKQNENIKYALAYIPLVSIFLFFTEKKASKEYKKNIDYSLILLWLYTVLNIILWWLIWALIFIAYIWISAFLWYKSYNWKQIDIELLNNILDKINNKLNPKIDYKNNSKKL